MARQFQVTLPYLAEKEKARTKNVVHMLRGLPFVYGLSTFEGKRDRLVIFRVTPKATGKCIYALQSVGVRVDGRRGPIFARTCKRLYLSRSLCLSFSVCSCYPSFLGV